MPEVGRALAEMDAYTRAVDYAAVDPFYEGKPITDREQALMRLAIRAFTMPFETDVATIRLQRAASRVKALKKNETMQGVVTA